MIFEVVIETAAQRQLDKLPEQERERLEAVIDRLAEQPRLSGVKKLQGYPDSWRIRVGDYRVLYRIEKRVLTVYVFEVSNRDRCYKPRK